MGPKFGLVVATCTAVASLAQAGAVCAKSPKAAKGGAAQAAIASAAVPTPALQLPNNSNAANQFIITQDGYNAVYGGPTFSASTLGVRGEAASAAAGGPFVFPAYTGTALDAGHLSQTDRLVESSGLGLARWRSSEFTLDTSSGAVDSVRLTVGGMARGAGGLVLARPDSLLDPEDQAFDVTYTRGWPSALKFSNGAYALDVSPHAGLGVSNAGGSAEAGAMIRFGADDSPSAEDRVRSGLSGVGLRTVDGSTFGNRGRWYVFAAASGKAVGLNMLRDGTTGGFTRSGLSMDPASALIADAQAGVGWRKGPMQASFGYLHREIKPSSGTAIMGMENKDDDMVAFSLSFKPRH